MQPNQLGPGAGGAMTATEKLAGFIANTAYRDIPEQVREACLPPIIDTVACIIAGLSSGPGEVITGYVGLPPRAGVDELTAPGLREGERALALGTLGAAIDYDDVSGNGHPSSILVAAILGFETDGKLSGERFVDAFAIGYEVSAKVGDMFHLPHSRHGWHTTSTAGVFGATAVACRLLSLDLQATKNALGIATSMSAGLGRNFGSMTKPLHSGLAARNGLEAARLAAAGVTAANDALGGPRGFVDVYGLGQGTTEPLEHLGHPWTLESRPASLKKYPSCYTTHRLADATLQLQLAHPGLAENFDSMIVRAPTKSSASLVYDRPATGLEGKFSVHYVAAAALLDGKLDMASFEDHAVQRPQIQELLPRIDFAEDPRCRPEDPEALNSLPITGGFWEVTVKTKDGTSVTTTSSEAPGSPGRLLSWTEISDKFSDCVHSAGYDRDSGRKLFAELRQLPSVDDVRDLYLALGPRKQGDSPVKEK